MNVINAIVSNKTKEVILNEEVTVVEGENLQSKLVFTFKEEFINGQARIEYETNGQKEYIPLDKEKESYICPIKSCMLKQGIIYLQLVITEGINEDEIPIFVSKQFYLSCEKYINAIIEQIDEPEKWINIANTKLNQVDNLDIDLEDNIITITKKDGTTKSENVKGPKGEKGEPGAIKMQFLNELPETGYDDTLYFIPAKEPTEDNLYDEYAWVNNDWEYLGTPKVVIDLTDYLKKSEIDEKGIVITKEDATTETVKLVVYK